MNGYRFANPVHQDDGEERIGRPLAGGRLKTFSWAALNKRLAGAGDTAGEPVWFKGFPAGDTLVSGFGL